MDSCRIERRSADVGEAVESPTPTPSSTALEAKSPAIDDEKACRESYGHVSFMPLQEVWRSSHISDI